MTMRAILIGMALGASPMLTACPDGDGDTDTDTDTATDLDGATLYTDNCSSCHGTDGTNGAAGPDLTERVPGKTAAQIETIVRDGSGNMPGFGTDVVTDAELGVLGTYVLAEWGN